MKTTEEILSLIESRQILSADLTDEEVLMVDGSTLDPQTSLKFIEKYGSVLSSRNSNLQELLSDV